MQALFTNTIRRNSRDVRPPAMQFEVVQSGDIARTLNMRSRSIYPDVDVLNFQKHLRSDDCFNSPCKELSETSRPAGCATCAEQICAGDKLFTQKK